MTMRLALTSLLLAVTSLLSFAAAQEADVTLTVDNRSADSYYLTTVEGTDAPVAELEVDNAAWALIEGQRYRIVNLGGDNHPFELRGEDDEVLISQLESNSGSFDADESVAFERDAEGITFTLTPELAEALRTYYCSYHPAMMGEITVS